MISDRRNLISTHTHKSHYTHTHTDPQWSVRSSFAEVVSPDKPRPVQIVKAKSDHTFDLDREALSEVLLSDEVRDRQVVVLSVAGAFRKGKSFLLDYILRFLDNGVSCFPVSPTRELISLALPSAWAHSCLCVPSGRPHPQMLDVISSRD